MRRYERRRAEVAGGGIVGMNCEHRCKWWKHRLVLLRAIYRRQWTATSHCWIIENNCGQVADIFPWKSVSSIRLPRVKLIL